jgi:hypothetical protein
MKTKECILLLFLCGIFTSCCILKEQNLGNNFILSEYDNVDRRILYSEETCSNSGIQIVPMTVLEYAYDTKWIIVKSGFKNKNESLYWIVNKDFKVKILKDNDSTLNIIKSHIIGPLDSTNFYETLNSKKINLILKKI